MNPHLILPLGMLALIAISALVILGASKFNENVK